MQYPNPPSWVPGPYVPIAGPAEKRAPHRQPAVRTIVTPARTTLAELAMRYRNNSRDVAVFRNVNPGIPDVIPAGTQVIIP